MYDIFSDGGDSYHEQSFASPSLCFSPVHLYKLLQSSFIINPQISRSTEITKIRTENKKIDTKR